MPICIPREWTAPFSCLRMEPAGAIPFFRQARERENGRSTQSDDRKTHSKTHSPCQGEWVWGERDKPTTSVTSPPNLTILPSPPQIGNILIRAVSGALKSGAPLRGAKILGFRAAARPKILIQGGREGSKICVARYARRF